MHKITRFIHLFKNYIFDSSENKNKSQSLSTKNQNKYINLNDNNLINFGKKITQKPIFTKKNLNKSKIYCEKDKMVGGNNHTISPSDIVPKKVLGGESTIKDNLNSQEINDENVNSMSLNYSNNNQNSHINGSVNNVEYSPVPQKTHDIELLKKEKKEIFSRFKDLFIFVFLGTFSICTLRYVRFRSVESMYIASVGLVVGESFKLILSIWFLTYEHKSFKKAMKILYVGTFINWKNSLYTGIPAFLYAIQNLLFQYAISYLDATVLLVTQQLKILTTALFAVTLLKSKLSGIQWISMVVLIMGIIMIQWKIPETKKSNFVATNLTVNDTKVEKKYYPLPNPLNIPPQIIGLFMVFVGTILSGFSSIFLEKIFKKTTQSLWCINFQLALFSVPIFLCVSLVTDYQKILEKGFFSGFDGWVVLVYFVFGLHGMVVALLLKHASSILKCFASGFIIAATAVVSIFLFNIYPNLLLIIGTVIILFAVYLYSTFPYKKKSTIVLSQKCDKESANA
ncbi:UDP-galactose translocator [Strongyloides ratti]|uniref:UDP-galactose translocator n=1 Tax=Strongyloides ratti TaxID=34506 RepID=A0A090LEC3_STRRB|nr:UDP-galactose translocator [Strongyloides ratti]CEF65855.1 UDP-galactose translocator [Strongyloides ratti]